jgi:two-component system sensor histidine kinase PhoQ
VKSLGFRVALSAALVLTVFLLLTSLALEQAFRDTARSAREERLLGQLYLLMAAGEMDDGHLLFPDELTEARFGLPGSGLYGAVLDDRGNAVWRSASTIGIDTPLPPPLGPGERRFHSLTNASDQAFLAAGFGITWATSEEPRRYTFAVMEDLSAFDRELARFRAGLAGWLGTMALLMLASLLLSLRWGLTPLRRVAGEIAAVESGRQEQIHGDYPAELRGLTDNLNALLVHERAHQKRLGNALGDLAHSLKTPLAVMRGAITKGAGDAQTVALFDEQLSRMDHMIEYQLQRARSRAGAAAGLAPPIPVLALVARLCAALEKVYRGKGVDTEIEIGADLRFRGVEGDLMELLGNLLDNAYKWCRGRVRVSAGGGRGLLEILVEDDGSGIRPSQVEKILERGTRADEETPGHGIGLAVAREICTAYGGNLRVEKSRLGGARFRVGLRT